MAGNKPFPKTQALGPGPQALCGLCGPCIFIGRCEILEGVSEQLSLVSYMSVRGRRKAIKLWLPSGCPGEGNKSLQSQCTERINLLPAVSLPSAVFGARDIPDVRVRLSKVPSSVNHRHTLACC